jgi:hypothetical protein
LSLQRNKFMYLLIDRQIIIYTIIVPVVTEKSTEKRGFFHEQVIS